MLAFGCGERPSGGRDTLTCPKDANADDMCCEFQVTSHVMSLAAPGELLHPCPPFTHGRKADAGVIESRQLLGTKPNRRF